MIINKHISHHDLTNMYVIIHALECLAIGLPLDIRARRLLANNCRRIASYADPDQELRSIFTQLESYLLKEEEQVPHATI